MSKPDMQLKKHQQVFRLNMLIGFIATSISIYLIITGQYDSIQARQTSETLLGWIAIVGMIYTVGFWFACMFRMQLFINTHKEP